MEPALALILAVIVVVGALVIGAPFYVAFFLGGAIIVLGFAGVGLGGFGAQCVDPVRTYSLLAIPLFVLLGSIMGICGAAKVLFELADAFVGRVPGGIGAAAFLGCAMFGAMCGSSVATSLAMAAVSLPPLREHGYSRGLGAAICATGGGLGQLIPPSIGFIITGMVLEINSGSLFIAGIVPGIICTAFLSLACYIRVRGKKEIKLARAYSWGERGRLLGRASPLILLPLTIVGSIWAGMATPTEAGGAGVIIGALLARFYFRKFGWAEIKTTLAQSATVSAAVYIIIVGGILFGRALAYMNIPQQIAPFIMNMGLGLGAFKSVLFGIFFIVGMFLDAIVIKLVVLPSLLPALLHYSNLDLISFGVMYQLISNIAELTPPVGLVLYSVAIGTDTPVMEVIREIPIFILAISAACFVTMFLPVVASIY